MDVLEGITRTRVHLEILISASQRRTGERDRNSCAF